MGQSGLSQAIIVPFLYFNISYSIIRHASILLLFILLLAAMTYNQVHYFRVDHLADFTQMDAQKSL